MTIRINEEHLGDLATQEQAERMVEILSDKGYDVAYGHGGESPNNVKDKDWEEALDIISKESYS